MRREIQTEPGTTTSRQRATWALVALAVAAFAYVTTEVLPVGLLTVMAADLGRSPSAMGLIITGYAAVVVVASLPLTRLTHRVPRRMLLTATLAVFTAAMLLSAVAPSYEVLLVARLLIALTQALFWSVAATTATTLFPPEMRGRVVARLSIGASLAPVLGVPAGTWLGQQVGWRATFGVMTGVALVTCLAVALLLTPVGAAERTSGPGNSPDTRRYVLLLVATVIAVTGFMSTQTYITPFLLDVGGFAPASLSALLLVSGVAGVAGTLAVGPLLDRRPRAALISPLILLTCALTGMYALGATQAVAVVGLGLMGLGFSALAPAIQNRTLGVAPGNMDLANAGSSSAFNVGIAMGSWLGGALLDATGTRSVAVAGAVLTAVALAVLLCEPWIAAATTRRSAPAAPQGGHDRRIRISG